MVRLGVHVAVVAALVSAVAAPAAARRADTTAVGVRTETFVDRRRPTPSDPTAGITPSPTRRLETTIYYPARGEAGSGRAAVDAARPASGRYPLVVFSPGSPGTPRDYESLLVEWASAGYVVAGVEYPISSLAGPDGAAWEDLPNQSEDARFVLRRMLHLDAGKLGIAEVDRDRIAVAGHSLGGATALSLVSKCCRDRRVDAAVILAGVTEPSDGPDLDGTRGPVLFAHARRDRAVAYGPARAACRAAKGAKRLLTVLGEHGPQAHTQPYLGTGEGAAVVRGAVLDFLDGYLKDKAPARRRVDRAGAGSGVVAVSRCRGRARP